MFSRRQSGTRALALLFGLAAEAQRREIVVPFEFAAGRGSLLVRARLDRREALLIVDTGSSHTIVRPSAVGVDPKELARPRTGVGVVGDAVGKEVTLEIGDRIWTKRRVAVMDLSQALSMYQEKVDGLLGIDFFLQFSEALVDLKKRTISFVP